MNALKPETEPESEERIELPLEMSCKPNVYLPS